MHIHIHRQGVRRNELSPMAALASSLLLSRPRTDYELTRFDLRWTPRGDMRTC